MNDKTIPHDNQTPETEKRSADLNPTLRTKGKPSCTTTTPARKPNYQEKLTPRQISYHLESPKHTHQNESTKGRENTISKHPSKPPTPTSDSHLDTPPTLAALHDPTIRFANYHQTSDCRVSLQIFIATRKLHVEYTREHPPDLDFSLEEILTDIGLNVLTRRALPHWENSNQEISEKSYRLLHTRD